MTIHPWTYQCNNHVLGVSTKRIGTYELVINYYIYQHITVLLQDTFKNTVCCTIKNLYANREASIFFSTSYSFFLGWMICSMIEDSNKNLPNLWFYDKIKGFEMISALAYWFVLSVCISLTVHPQIQPTTYSSLFWFRNWRVLSSYIGKLV